MKTDTYTLILLISLLLACSPAMPPAPVPPDTSALYRAAAAKHYQLAHGEIPSTEAEWDALIEEFDGVIDADVDGEWADDAQYAIASCWLWLGQRNEQPALDNAITALTTTDSKTIPIHHTQRRHITGWGIATIGFEITAKQYPTIKRSSVAIPTTQSPTRHSCGSAKPTKHKVIRH